jgi:hypothetical protein
VLGTDRIPLDHFQYVACDRIRLMPTLFPVVHDVDADAISGRKPIPKPGFLDRCEYLGFVYGERRWRDPNEDLLYTWGALHGEIEMFTYRGRHAGVADIVTGDRIKPAERGRRIRV